MPEIVPTRNEIKMICEALSNVGLLSLPGAQLLSNLEILASQTLPEALSSQQLPHLDGNKRSLHLAIAVLMTAPNPCDAESAINDFQELRTPLLEAWEAVPHSGSEKMRKTIDQVIASGSLRGRQGALEALYYLILGDHSRSTNPARPFIPGYPPHNPELPHRIPIGAVEWLVNFLAGGLIPNLDQHWGGFQGAFAEDGRAHAAELRSWLLKPVLDMPFRVKETFTIRATSGGVSLGTAVKSMMPGAKRTMRLRTGFATLHGPVGDALHLSAGQRVILRALDGGKAQIQLAECRTDAMAGRICSLSDGQAAVVEFDDPFGSILESWSCTCGCCQCDRRHRLEVWDPRAFPANASLRSFLLFGIKGPPAFNMGRFVCTMYYGLLSSGV